MKENEIVNLGRLLLRAHNIITEVVSASARLPLIGQMPLLQSRWVVDHLGADMNDEMNEHNYSISGSS